MGNRFKELREKKFSSTGTPMSIRMLAKELGISPSHVSEIERDVMSPSLLMLTKYHKYFDVSIEYLLGEEETNVSIEKGIITEKDYTSSKDKLSKEIDVVLDAKTRDECLEKQLVEFLFTTSTGKVLIHELAGILFGVTNENYKDADILQNMENGEYSMIHTESMDMISRRFANALVILRDPLYRKMSYNELQLLLTNTGINSVEDTYSRRCKFE